MTVSARHRPATTIWIKCPSPCKAAPGVGIGRGDADQGQQRGEGVVFGAIGGVGRQPGPQTGAFEHVDDLLLEPAAGQGVTRLVELAVDAAQGVYAMSLEYLILLFIAANGTRLWVIAAKRQPQGI